MTKQAPGNWRLDSCEALTRASYPPLLPRGRLWAPSVWGDDVVRGAGNGGGMEYANCI